MMKKYVLKIGSSWTYSFGGLTSLKRKSCTKVSEYKFCPMYVFFKFCRSKYSETIYDFFFKYRSNN